jgi:hypothetical protein
MASMQMLKAESNPLTVTNPYSSLMPVTIPVQFYGRHDDVLRVAESIRNWQPYAVSGEPRIGKTSFLYFLIHPEGARTLPEFLAYVGSPEDYLFVLVELQRLPVRNATGFWRYLLDRLSEEARNEAIEPPAELKEYPSSWEQESDYYQVQTHFESYLKQLKRRVLFLFDDFDIVINDLDNTEVVQVTDKLRTLKEALDLNGKLNYVIVSTDPLVRLLKEKGITSPSPFTSIIIPMAPLGLLEKDAADQLLQEPLRLHAEQSFPQFTKGDIAFIYKLAGRYPGIMKTTCSYMFAARYQGNVDYDSVRQNIEDDSNIRWLLNGLWERIKQEEQLEGLPLREALLQIAQGHVLPVSPAFRELRQRGLVDDSTSPPRIFGDLFHAYLLYPQSHEVTPIELTSMESKLYNYLAENVGQTCSRDRLQKVIWGDKLPTSRDALEQLVKRVRGKIEPNPDRPIYLQNVRGQGYRLEKDPSK